MEEPDQSLYFLSETEQSLLIGEGIELGHESDSNDSHSDTDSDIASGTESDSADEM